MSLIPIKQYRDFWDVPRIFLTLMDGDYYLFDCRFDEEKEDFEKEYRVYLMPELTNEDLSASWSNLSDKATRFLGRIAVISVKFDDSKRLSIDESSVTQVLNQTN